MTAEEMRAISAKHNEEQIAGLRDSIMEDCETEAKKGKYSVKCTVKEVCPRTAGKLADLLRKDGYTVGVSRDPRDGGSFDLSIGWRVQREGEE